MINPVWPIGSGIPVSHPPCRPRHIEGAGRRDGDDFGLGGRFPDRDLKASRLRNPYNRLPGSSNPLDTGMGTFVNCITSKILAQQSAPHK
jgi:hypothetical protein